MRSALKALARDVADRYQTAAQLAADLDALIAGYRFDPKELRQFMRQLFRKEYAKEQEDTQLALDAEPGGASITTTGRMRPLSPTSPPPEPTTQASGPSSALPPPQPAPPGAVPAAPPAPQADDDRPRGFWGSLFKKRK